MYIAKISKYLIIPISVEFVIYIKVSSYMYIIDKTLIIVRGPTRLNPSEFSIAKIEFYGGPYRIGRAMALMAPMISLLLPPTYAVIYCPSLVATTIII